MTPLQQFRIWARRAPSADRATAAVVAAIVLALVVWLTIPVHKGSGANELLTSGAAAGASGATGSTVAGAAGATTGSSTSTTLAVGGVTSSVGGTAGSTASGGAGAASSAAGGCVSPPGSDQGVTANQISIAIALVNIVGPAGNSTFAVPSTDEQQMDFDQVIAALNDAGGVACRKLVPRYFQANPVNSGDLQQKCLDIADAKPFFVIDTGGFYGSPVTNCFPQHQLPFLGNGRISSAQHDQFYPYLFGQGSIETLYRDTVFAHRDRGAFSPDHGFKKLGYIYRSCFPDVVKQFMGWLQQAGVPSSQVVTYDVGCPDGFANPSDIQQAILKFQGSGVSDVTTTFFTQDFANFTKIAQQQRFKPRYLLADDGVVPTTAGSLHPDFDNIADSVAIDDSRFGEENTPGMSPTAGTQKCDAVYKAHGRPPVYKQSVGFGGLACGQVWMAAAAIGHAPVLHRDALADGLHAAKALDFPFPLGPADFGAPKVTYGAQFWRPVQFNLACSCWRVIDPAFHPKFP